MDTSERSCDIYEYIATYPKPPLIPVPDKTDVMAFLEELDQTAGRLPRWITRAAMYLNGFERYLKRLPESLEDSLRHTDLRGGALFSPVISASLALADDTRKLSPIQRAVTLIFAARSLYQDVMSGKLPPDRYKDSVLEMGQYPNLFSTCLIVEGKRARIFKSKNTSDITVIIGGNFYTMSIGDAGADLEFEQLEEALAKLIQQVRQHKSQSKEVSPGILTCAEHGTQLRIFQQLQRSEINRASLNALRNSFVTLCFDLEHEPKDHAEAAIISHIGNNANRWFHSSLQIVVFGNARASVICNFSTYLDGNPMMRASAELQKRASACPISDESEHAVVSSIPSPTKLQWEIDSNQIQLAEKDFLAIRDEQQATFEITGIGKRLFLKYNFQPIPVFVVALQMATKELIGRIVRITQFMTMSRFRCMDLVTPNVTTPEMVHFVDYIQSDEIDNVRAKALLNEAISSQLQEMRKARKKFPIPEAFVMQAFVEKGWRRWYVSLIFSLQMMLLNLLGVPKKLGREVLISHPEIYPEVPVVGRPGVRLPYVRYVGLHYQIMDEKIIITFMPGLKWNISNQDFIKVLEKCLKRISSIIQTVEKV